MSVTITFEITMRCPRHPRYNPGRDGLAAIKGGCTTCTRMFELNMKANQVFATLSIEVKRSATELNFFQHIACRNSRGT